MGRQRRLKLVRHASSNVVTGIAWYRPAQWARLRQLAADPDVLEETYAQWLVLAEQAVSDMRAHGINAQTVDIDVEELLIWCQATGHQLDQKARAAFASIKLQGDHAESKPTRPGGPHG